MMPAGKYWVGDLCYVLDEDWNECCYLFFKERNDNGCNEGEFTLSDGRRFVSLNTAWGDGYYIDNSGRGYGVDAGLIGCILAKDVGLEGNERNVSGGHIIDFPTDFECSNDDGKIIIGDVVIDTDPDIDSEYNEDEN